MLNRLALVLAIAAATAVLASGPGTRTGLWPWQVGLALFALAGLTGVAAAVMAALGRRYAVLVVGAVAAVMPLAALVQALSVPRINEVSNALVLAEPADKAFARAQAAAQVMEWEIVKSDSKAGRIDAVATTFWFGFKDDIAVQVAADGKGSKVEVRSKSRVGKGDSGTNAKRIATYFERMK